MTKFRLYVDKEKETEFLNEMARQGYAMTGFVLGFYSFDPCQPGEYIYQIDITEGMFRVSNDYREFMRDMEVEIVCLWGPWVILRKKAAEGSFVLYTDVESRVEHYTKIKRLFKGALTVEIICIFVEILAGLGGNALGWAFTFILAAISISMFRELIRVNGILAELRGRAGEETEERSGAKKPSGFLALGFLLNAVGFLLTNTGTPDSGNEMLKGFFHGMALVAFLVGLVHTWWKKK